MPKTQVAYKTKVINNFSSYNTLVLNLLEMCFWVPHLKAHLTFPEAPVAIVPGRSEEVPIGADTSQM